jgi:hypothetical protein
MGGTVYTAGASYTVTGDVTLTARWAFSSVSDIPAYLSGMSGGMSAADPLPLPAGLNLADGANGWDALLGAIPSGKYVALDLSISAMGAPSFNPALSPSSGKDKIVSLVLPDTPFSIADGADVYTPTFNGFTNLKRVSGDGVTGVGQYAFSYYIPLEEVRFPAAASIDQYAFYHCSSLPEVSLPMATSIGNFAFQYCTALTEVSLPKVTSLGIYAFRDCTSLAMVNLSSVTTFGTAVFDSTGGTPLTITMGSTAPTMGTGTFDGTSGKSVTVKVPSTAYSLYDTTWQTAFKGGNTSVNLIMEAL